MNGGYAPFTYSWAPSGGTSATETGLAAGTYTVTVELASFAGVKHDGVVVAVAV